jgi:hypothetical protein
MRDGPLMAGCTCIDYAPPSKDCSVHGEQAQPLPIGNNLPVIHTLVQEDLQQRLEWGTAKYGQPLQPFNGRSALRDAYEEILDCAVYLRQKIWEEEHGNASAAGATQEA